jgi:hypothetical protein
MKKQQLPWTAEEREAAVVFAAGALLLADVIAHGLPGAPGTIKPAFDLAEAFITEAEKRLPPST